jgi:ribonuclease HI
MTIKRALMYTDGACKGNPGPMGIGVVIKNEDGQTVKKHSEFLGHGTNNQAEYMALKRGLEHAKNENINHLTIFSDSELLVDHVNGKKTVTNPELLAHMQDIKKHIGSFDYVAISHVRRHLNAEADRAANMAFKQEADSLD